MSGRHSHGCLSLWRRHRKPGSHTLGPSGSQGLLHVLRSHTSPGAQAGRSLPHSGQHSIHTEAWSLLEKTASHFWPSAQGER